VTVALLKVVANMIRQSKPDAETMEVKKLFLSDLTILCKNNKDNRRYVVSHGYRVCYTNVPPCLLYLQQSFYEVYRNRTVCLSIFLVSTTFFY